MRKTDIVFAILKIAAALLLVLLNGLFVAAEFAFVKVRPTRMSQLVEEGTRHAASAYECVQDIDVYLSVSQLGITLASLGLGWLGEPAVAALLSPLLYQWGISSPALVHSISFVVGFSLITFLHVVFGELAPKSLAIQKAESLALILAGPMKFFYRIFYPAVVVLNGTANFVIRRLGIEPAAEGDIAHTEEEIHIIISESYKSGHINESEKELLQNVFRFETLVASDIMVPRPEVKFLDTSLDLQQNIHLAEQGGHTRFPVHSGSPDNVVGMVNIKDMLYINGKMEKIQDIMRDVMFVPESMPLDRLLHAFQKNHQHMAIVLDEYGGNAGIVTLENVLEELVGDIQDEFDEEEPDIRALEDGSYIVSGRMLIEDAEERFGLKTDDDEEYDTLAGLVLEKLGNRPVVGNTVLHEGFRLEVVQMQGMRIDRIRLSPVNKPRVSPPS